MGLEAGSLRSGPAQLGSGQSLHLGLPTADFSLCLQAAESESTLSNLSSCESTDEITRALRQTLSQCGRGLRHEIHSGDTSTRPSQGRYKENEVDLGSGGTIGTRRCSWAEAQTAQETRRHPQQAVTFLPSPTESFFHDTTPLCHQTQNEDKQTFQNTAFDRA